MSPHLHSRHPLRCLALGAMAAAGVLAAGHSAQAFCGFYVSQGTAPLYNEASKVVLAWDDGQATVTMASDYHGEPREFGLVIPVPVVVQKSDIRVVGMNLVDKLDAYSQPRLTEYYDRNPCPPPEISDEAPAPAMAMPAAPAAAPAESMPAPPPKIVIEARYEVGVYDIVILKAEESTALTDYLTANGYKLPAGAAEVLASYIAQNMHFFLAKVNLDRQNAAGEKFLRPIQVSYRSTKFMLPIRLGTVNARGPQDLLVFALTRHGRVESVNYRTSQMPTHLDVPVYVRTRLDTVYHAAFDKKVRQDGMADIYTEYAWDLSGYCDPCSAEKPAAGDLYVLGARWEYPGFTPPIDAAGTPDLSALPMAGDSGFLTRLHVRYDRRHFPEDLAFQETEDASPYQVVYSVHHPAGGDLSCPTGQEYSRQLPIRFRREAQNLQDLTGWKRGDILADMAQSGEGAGAGRTFYERFVDLFP